jgi:hypothetical protein
MATRLFIGKDLNGTPCDTIYVAENIVRGILGAGVAENITVPANVDTAYFAYGGAGNVWVDLQNTASVPGSTQESSTAELNPVSRFVTPGATVSIICSVINEYQVSFYAANKRQL